MTSSRRFTSARSCGLEPADREHADATGRKQDPERQWRGAGRPRLRRNKGGTDDHRTYQSRECHPDQKEDNYHRSQIELADDTAPPGHLQDLTVDDRVERVANQG